MSLSLCALAPVVRDGGKQGLLLIAGQPAKSVCRSTITILSTLTQTQTKWAGGCPTNVHHRMVATIVANNEYSVVRLIGSRPPLPVVELRTDH